MITTTQTIGYLGANSAIFTISVLVAIKTVQTLRSWDFSASTKEQYDNEQRLHLLSSTASFLIAAKTLLTLFLFYMIDSLTPFIKAAMCGVGVVNATSYGWELIVLKIVLLYLLLLWLATDRADRERLDYPFAVLKMRFFLAIFVVMILEILLDFGVVVGLDTQKVVSCCSVTFANSNQIGEMFLLKPQSVAIYFGSVYVIYTIFGVLSIYGAPLKTRLLHFVRNDKVRHCEPRKRRGNLQIGFLEVSYENRILILAFGIFGLLFGAVGMVAIIYLISPYIYELPTHTCPFCILQKEYNYVGYLLYISLFLGSYLGVQSSFKRLVLGVKASLDIKRALIFSGFFVLLVAYFIVGYIIKNGTDLF